MKVLYFSWIKDKLGKSHEEIQVSDNIKTINDLITLLKQNNENYKDIQGFCKTANLEEVERNKFILTPSRYVGMTEVKDDGEPFDEKIKRLISLYKDQQKQVDQLDKKISENMRSIGFE